MTVEKSRSELKGAAFEAADGEALNVLSFRTRVAVLWVAVAVALSTSMLLSVFVPGAVEEMLAGEMEGETLTNAVGFRLAIFVIIPVVMAAVTLLIRDRVNRYVNLIIGLVYGLFGSHKDCRSPAGEPCTLPGLGVTLLAVDGRRKREVLMRTRSMLALVSVLTLLMTVAVPATGAVAPYITLDPGVPAGSSAIGLINVGDEIGDFVFEGIPDGVGIMPGTEPGTIDVFVAHEQTTVPFFNTADFQDASVSRLTIDLVTNQVLSGSVAIDPADGFLRFCSAFMAGPPEGFEHFTFFVNEEANDIVDVPAGAPYEPDPVFDGQRQAGFAVGLRAASGELKVFEGMGRLNHENTVAIPGYGERKVLLTTDDTFSGPSAQLYMYTAANEDQLWEDKASLWAFQVTRDGSGQVNPNDAFNGANDYLDLDVGEVMQGRFIPVPEKIANGDTDEAPQTALENWSNEHNVFQFIRLEDLAYDRNNPNRIYIADTGRSRVVPDPATGRLVRGPGGTVGFADNGSVFVMELNDNDPKKVDAFYVLAQGDDSLRGNYVPFVAPDNLDTSANSLMVQEDNDNAKIWQHRLGTNEWQVVATVNDPDGESSGITSAADWYGEGSWLLTVQAHGTFVDAQPLPDGTLAKREDGQLLLMTIPGS